MSENLPQCMVLHTSDNVGVALRVLTAGEHTGIGNVRCRQDIPAGHKLALDGIPSGAPVFKYGWIVGFASQPIQAGDHVHVHNMVMGGVEKHYEPGVDVRETDYVSPKERAFFDGFVRPDGAVGTRNYIGVLATVSCSNSVSQFIADAVPEKLLANHTNVDGVVALGHGSGCSMAPDSEGFHLLQRTIAGYARNPNFGGVLIVGLGCEVNLAHEFMHATGLQQNRQLMPLVIQEAGGTKQTVQKGLAAIEAMLPGINACSRQKVPVDHLVVGLECGGSDAYSGITANPALGAAVDLLVRHGGTAILSETPEIYGAEHLLMRRASSPEIAEQLEERIRWWEAYTELHGAQINNNPTPGNKAGGITTILEKSMGAVAKAGSTNLNAVYQYAEKATQKGLVFMDTPGNDVVSITGMIAGGSNLICFTTGRGSVCGFRPAPTLKLATNSAMFRRMEDDMDINCGRILDGHATLAEMGEEIFREMVLTASGKKTKSEMMGFGSHEFVPWPMGAVL